MSEPVRVSEAVAAKFGALSAVRHAMASGKVGCWQVPDGRHFAARSAEDAEALASRRPLTMAGRVERSRARG